MSSAIISLIGSELRLNGSNDTVSTAKSNVAGADVVGIYFSAHWCPPCRKFTPMLVETLASVQEAGKSFEIVFVTGDKDEAQFEEYLGEMDGFHALPYGSPSIGALNRKFKVQGIPHLVLVDGKTGKPINGDARGDVSSDPMGKGFPWADPTLEEALGEHFINGAGEKVKVSDVTSKTFALYFSAHWCPPCKGFTPQLVETYKKVKAAGNDFEVVFVSSDRDKSQFEEYFAEMPWLALDYADRKRKAQLSKMFGVEGIPTLVICGPGGKVINAKGRAAVSGDPAGAEFPWQPKAVNSIESPDGINENPSFVLFCDKESEERRGELKALVDAIAESKRPKEEDGEWPMLFFTGMEAGGRVAPQIRKLCKDESGGTLACIMDIPDDGGYYVLGTDATDEAIRGFVDDYCSGALKGKRQQLSRM